MNDQRYFDIAASGSTLTVTVCRNVSSLMEDRIDLELAEVIRQLQPPEIRHLVIDFSPVDYFGSGLLEALLELWRHIKSRPGTMALCGLSKVTLEILRVGRFDTLWPIFATRDEALRFAAQES